MIAVCIFSDVLLLTLQLLGFHCCGRSLTSITPTLTTGPPSTACIQTELFTDLSLLLSRSVHVQCESEKSPPPNISNFFPNGWEFLVQILHTKFSFLSTVHYQIICNFDEVMPYYAQPPSSHHMFKMSTIGRNARWHFMTFSPNSSEVLVQILHTHYTILFTLDYKFLLNYLQL